MDRIVRPVSFRRINSIRARVARIVREASKVTSLGLGDRNGIELAPKFGVNYEPGAYVRTGRNAWVLRHGEGRFCLEGSKPKVFSDADITTLVTSRYIPSKHSWADTIYIYNKSGDLLLKKKNEYLTSELYHYFGWQR